MYEYTSGLVAQKKPNPFYKNIQGLQMMQARIYANQDHLLPED